MLERVPATLELVGASTLLALCVALPVGVLASVHRLFDRVTSFGAVAGISLPVFWFGLLLQLVFAITLGWLPSSGRASFGASSFADRLAHLVLPVVVLAAVQAAAWSRYLRRAMRETIGRPFMNAARVRGVSERGVLLRHALPNALGPFVTVVLLDAAMSEIEHSGKRARTVCDCSSPHTAMSYSTSVCASRCDMRPPRRVVLISFSMYAATSRILLWVAYCFYATGGKKVSLTHSDVLKQVSGNTALTPTY
jgi:hypothetical protein